MRPIEFRAWDKKNKRMSVDVQSFQSFHRLYNRPSNYWGFHKMLEAKNRFEVMQYTGLKDKNGVKIFEGDTMTVDRGVLSPTSYRKTIAVVTITEHRTYGVPRDGHMILPSYDFKEEEIIGNRFENPKLLERKDGR